MPTGIFLYIEASDMSDPATLQFNYTTKEYGEDYITFDMQFSEPELVSTQGGKEKLYLHLIDFRDSNGELIARD